MIQLKSPLNKLLLSTCNKRLPYYVKLVLDQLLSEKRPLSREKLILSCPCLIDAPLPPPPLRKLLQNTGK